MAMKWNGEWTRRVFFLLFLIVPLVSHTSFGENANGAGNVPVVPLPVDNSHNAAGATPGKTFQLPPPSVAAGPGNVGAAGTAGVSGPTDSRKLEPYQLDFLAAAFPKVSRDQLWARYWKTLPEAMDDAAKWDENGQGSQEKLTDILVKLVGTFTDPSEEKNMLDQVDKAWKAAKEHVPMDKGFMALLKRLKAEAAVRQGKPLDSDPWWPDAEKLDAFNKLLMGDPSATDTDARVQEEKRKGKLELYDEKRRAWWAAVNNAANGSGETQKAGIAHVANTTDPAERKSFFEKFMPAAQASSDPRLKTWAANWEKVKPLLANAATTATPAGTTALTPGNSTAVQTPGLGGTPVINPAKGQTPGVLNGVSLAAVQTAFKQANCVKCHSRVDINPDFSVTVNNPATKNADPAFANRTFANLLNSGNNDMNAAIASIRPQLEKWKQMFGQR